MGFRVEFQDGRTGRWHRDPTPFTTAAYAEAYAKAEYSNSHARRKAGQRPTAGIANQIGHGPKDYFECYDVMCASCDRSASDCARYPRPECVNK